MNLTNEKKLELFERMLLLETLANKETFDNVNYEERANGFYESLVILGLKSEYIEWSIGK